MLGEPIIRPKPPISYFEVTVADATGCLRVVRRRCGCTAGCRRVKLNPIHGGNLALAADAGSRTPRYSLAEGYVHLI